MVEEIGSLSVTEGEITNVEWKIDNFFSRLRERFNVGLSSWLSPTFKVQDEEWKFFEGKRASSDCLMVIRYNPTKPSNVRYRLGIKASDGSSHRYVDGECVNYYSFSAEGILDWDNFMRNHEVISQNGTVTFFVELAPLYDNKHNCGESSPQNCATKDDVGAASEGSNTNEEGAAKDDNGAVCEAADTSEEDLDVLTQTLNNMLLKKLMCDVKMRVGGRDFYAHSLVLSVRSSVFASQLDHSTKKLQIIDIVQCDPDAFEDFLSYMYSSKVRDLPTRHAVALYDIAARYGMSKLTHKCVKQIIRNGYSVDSFCDLFMLATNHGELELLKSVQDFFNENTVEILRCPEWLSFIEKYASMANALFLNFVIKNKEH